MPPDDPAARFLAPNPQRAKNGVAWVEGTGYLNLLAYWDEQNRVERAMEKTVAHLAGIPCDDIRRARLIVQEENKAAPGAAPAAIGPW